MRSMIENPESTFGLLSALSRDEQRLRRVLRDRIAGHAAAFQALQTRYGGDVPVFKTAPEVRAIEAFETGVELCVMTERDRPAFVRRWS
jgi:hypothetical protein